jgi:hypothetical protein
MFPPPEKPGYDFISSLTLPEAPPVDVQGSRCSFIGTRTKNINGTRKGLKSFGRRTSKNVEMS